MTITVKLLKQLLQHAPDEALVILAADIAGNSYSPAYCYTPQAAYQPWGPLNLNGKIYIPSEVGYHKRQTQPAIVLWPPH